MLRIVSLILISVLYLATVIVSAQDTAAVKYDPELAKRLGADERGMRSFILVVLKTGPTKVQDAGKRSQMFKGHQANIQRLADEEKLVFAGPLDGVDGWRGVFILATTEIDTAKSYMATDPVIINGEMIAEYHSLYGTAGLMMLNEISRKIKTASP